MDQLIRGIVIRTTRYSDQAFICHIFTETHGLKAFMVRSGKSPRSSRAHLLQPLSVIEFETHFRENSRIHNVKNLNLNLRFHEIPFDPAKGSTVLFMNELLGKTMEDDYQNGPLFEFIIQSLTVLDHENQVRNFPLWFILELSRFYGFYPRKTEKAGSFFDLSSGMFCAGIPAHTAFLRQELGVILHCFIDADYSVVRDIQMDQPLRRELLEGVVRFLQLHLENLKNIQSLDVLREVFR